VEETTYGFRRVGRFAADALERLVDGVCVGEDVVSGFPVRMLVGGAETRYSERRRISECSTEVGGEAPSCAAAVSASMIAAGSSPRRLWDSVT
jgi:hypothetical protein